MSLSSSSAVNHDQNWQFVDYGAYIPYSNAWAYELATRYPSLSAVANNPVGWLDDIQPGAPKCAAEMSTRCPNIDEDG